jgi:hypothetical protein
MPVYNLVRFRPLVSYMLCFVRSSFTTMKLQARRKYLPMHGATQNILHETGVYFPQHWRTDTRL